MLQSTYLNKKLLNVQNLNLIIKNFYAFNSKSINKDFDYCMNLVKTSDYENYLCSMLLPNDIMRGAFTIRAFNVEMANVSVSVRDTNIGLARLKWWKERVDTIYKNNNFNLTNEPITSELTKTIRTHKLSRHWLMRLIESREEQLKNKGFYQTVKDVEQFGEMSVSTVYYLLLECLNIKNVHCDHVASHLGKAQIIANLVRSIPFQSKSNLSFIPVELLVKHKISQNDIIRLTNKTKSNSNVNQNELVKVNENFKNLLFELCNLSNQHLQKARKLATQIPPHVYVLFINSINIESFLNKIQKYNFDIKHPNVHSRDVFAPLKLYMAKLKNKY